MSSTSVLSLTPDVHLVALKVRDPNTLPDDTILVLQRTLLDISQDEDTDPSERYGLVDKSNLLSNPVTFELQKEFTPNLFLSSVVHTSLTLLHVLGMAILYCLLTLADEAASKTISLSPMTLETYVMRLSSDFSNIASSTKTEQQQGRYEPPKPPSKSMSDITLESHQQKEKTPKSQNGPGSVIALFLLYGGTIGAVLWLITRKATIGSRKFVLWFMLLFCFCTVVQYYVFFK